MKLFERVVELKVGETTITGLDIAFEIEKEETPEPNPCHVEIFNLSADNRATLSKYKHMPVLLKAGYKNSIGVIFQGDMIRCSHLKEGSNWKTVLAIGDGALAIQTKRMSEHQSFGAKSKTLQMRRSKEPLQKEAITLSVDSGLIASLEMGAHGEITLRSVLMAEFLPGRKIHVESASFKGFATIKVVRFSGVNLGKEWEA